MHTYIIFAFAGVMAILTAVLAVKGVKDINAVYAFTVRNEEYIMECRQNGTEDVKIPELDRDGLSECCAVKYLKYIDGYNSNSWPNIYMAKYYGVRSVSFSGEIVDVNNR